MALLFAGLVLTLTGPATARQYSSIVIDFESGQVLSQSRADILNRPASMTKMMTLYMLFDALDAGKLTLKTRLKVSRRAAGMAPSKLGLKRGQTISVENAILALVTKSANDVAVVVAEALGGTEAKFARMMTEKARKKLGMTRTTFRNASGLPNRNQRSTARDMARLSIALLRDHKKYYAYFSTTKFTYKGRSYGNHNQLLKYYEGTDGIKTGYTRSSGYNLAASVERDGRRLVAVVFGGKKSSSRDKQMVKLLDRGFATTMVAYKQVKPTQLAAPKPMQLAQQIGKRQQLDQLVASVSSLSLVSAANAQTPSAEGQTDAESVNADIGPWAVQVGAYRRPAPAKQRALQALDKIPNLQNTAKVAVTPRKGKTGTLYRARLVGLSESTARSACQLLEKKAVNCLVVLHNAS
jgi:D-alanyl-D-alanine carboxypeptidase|tara:strand:+ start:450 stop:1679 length:1230 start_codon:yes stop_codon:yes gene_type:complete